LLLLVLPYLGSINMRSGAFRPIYKLAFYSFVTVTFILGWIGSMPIALSLFVDRTCRNMLLFFVSVNYFSVYDYLGVFSYP
jgi:quinol-cytochrome oxidoreductase complex cytochrome b subunit